VQFAPGLHMRLLSVLPGESLDIARRAHNSSYRAHLHFTGQHRHLFGYNTVQLN